MTTKTPHVLIILDGWGYSETSESNAIKAATTPVWDRLWASCPRALVSGSGEDVGLPDGQMGNSEVGHMNLGAGRILYQELTKITKAVDDGSFYENPALCAAVDKATQAGRNVHIMGLCSDGGVHSHHDHIVATIELANRRQAHGIYFHAFTDGRDTPPRSAQASLQKVEDALKVTGKGYIASLSGRYFGMDRDNRWERVEPVYRLLTEGVAEYDAKDAQAGLVAAYERGENDEFVATTRCGEKVTIEQGDAVIFINFRADRARELSRAFTDVAFSGFERQSPLDLSGFVTLTHYADDIRAEVAYPATIPQNTLGEYCANLGKTQLRIAETEKYAHVTFFFSGGREALFDGEVRELIASPDVVTYDLQPEMNAPEVTQKLCAAIESGDYDLIVCNYANGDMVGHTGNFDAAMQAAEAIDVALAAVELSVLKAGGHCLVTADHGNIEQMFDEATGQAHTAHTCESVPLVYIGQKKLHLQDGKLSDIAPTLLSLMALDQPAEMTGKSLVHFVE